MDRQKQREISRKGGESVAPEHRSFSKDRTLASEAGRKGAESRNVRRQREAAQRAAQREESSHEMAGRDASGRSEHGGMGAGMDPSEVGSSESRGAGTIPGGSDDQED
jgi:general stress protein YciG